MCRLRSSACANGRGPLQRPRRRRVRLQRRDLQLPGPAPELEGRGHRFTSDADTEVHRRTCTRSCGADFVERSTACSPSRSRTIETAGWCWPAIAPARSRCSTIATAGGSCSHRKSRRSSPHPGVPLRIDDGAIDPSTSSTATCRIRTRSIGGCVRLEPAAVVVVEPRPAVRADLLAPRIPESVCAAAGQPRGRTRARSPAGHRGRGAASRSGGAARRDPQRRHRLYCRRRPDEPADGSGPAEDVPRRVRRRRRVRRDGGTRARSPARSAPAHGFASAAGGRAAGDRPDPGPRRHRSASLPRSPTLSHVRADPHSTSPSCSPAMAPTSVCGYGRYRASRPAGGSGPPGETTRDVTSTC